MINKALCGGCRADPLLNQPHHLNIANPIANPSNYAITNPHRCRRLDSPIIHSHLPARAGVSSITARTEHAHRDQPPIKPNTLHAAILAAPSRRSAFDASFDHDEPFGLRVLGKESAARQILAAGTADRTKLEFFAGNDLCIKPRHFKHAQRARNVSER